MSPLADLDTRVTLNPFLLDPLVGVGKTLEIDLVKRDALHGLTT